MVPKGRKIDELEEKLIDIVANHPDQIRESHEHKPGETYVKIGNKRVYFTQHSLPEITGIYERSQLYGAYRKIRKFFRGARHNGYWLNLFRPEIFFSLAGAAAIIYFCIEPEEAKIQRFEKICSFAAGFKEGRLLDDGRMKFSGRRNVIDGTSEPVEITADPAGWLFFRGNNEVKRYIPENRASVTKSFDYDGGDVWYGKEHGAMGGDKIIWDAPQGTGERKEKIYGHTKTGDVLTDFGKK